MCMRHDPCCLCWSNGATRVSPANVGSCLEPGPPFEMMMIMDSVLSLMESESSLGTNKQAGAGNAKYPHLPMSPISSKDVTMLLSLPSHSSPQAQTHTRGYIHTHTHTHVRRHTQWYFLALRRSTTQPLWPDFKVSQSRHTQLGLPERLSLGSGVMGSRGLKLILSLWSCSTLFSLLSKCYRRLASLCTCTETQEKRKKKRTFCPPPPTFFLNILKQVKSTDVVLWNWMTLSLYVISSEGQIESNRDMSQLKGIV